MYKKTPINAAWHSDKPTLFVVSCFERGFIKCSDSVIDIGCGFGRNANWLSSKNADVTAVNIDNDELAEAKQKSEKLRFRPHFILGNFLELDFNERRFDTALDLGCSHMLSKTDQLLFEKQVAKIIKPGGLLVYFGFSKKHPAYDNSKPRAIYRDIEDIQSIYGDDFVVIYQNECRWKPTPEENSNFSEHIGLNVIMRRS
jgi:ubiquinone/menaquinone biosynthesis C-methylase UbiE